MSESIIEQFISLWEYGLEIYLKNKKENKIVDEYFNKWLGDKLDKLKQYSSLTNSDLGDLLVAKINYEYYILREEVVGFLDDGLYIEDLRGGLIGTLDYVLEVLHDYRLSIRSTS